MKIHFVFKLFLVPWVILSCSGEKVIPKGYYRAKITGEFCTLAVQVKGSKISRELDKYEYIYIKNLPKELTAIGTEFYFKSWEDAEPPGACLANTYFPI